MTSQKLRALTGFILIACLLSPMAAPLAAQAKPASTASAGWMQVSQFGGPTEGLVVQNGYAYLGWGPRLAVVQVSDPAHPLLVGRSGIFGDQVQDIAVSGGLAYVAAGADGLRILNVSSPAAPVEVGHWQSPGYAEGVTVVGTTVYLANGPYGLQVLNAANPANLLEIGRAYEMDYVYDVAVDGKAAYLAAGGAGVLAVDLSNPGLVVEMGAYDTPGYAYALAASNGLVYVADGWGGLQILYGRDLDRLTLLGNLATADWVMDLAVSGSTVYLASGGGGLQLVNASNPAAPQALGAISWRFGHAAGVAVSGGTAFVADFYGGLRVINTANPAQPAQVGMLELVSMARQVAVSGNYAYIAAGFSGLHVINMSNLAKPYEVAAIQQNAYTQCLTVAGNRLYAGTMPDGAGEGLYAYDISNPANPVLLGAYDAHIECHDLEVAGTMAYIADSYGMHIVDFSNPAAPVLRGRTSLGEYTNGVGLSGSLAFVTVEAFHESFAGIKVYNIANPANIIQVGALSYKNAWDVLVSGSTAYVSLNSGLLVVDVTNPAAMVARGMFDSLGSTFDMALVNNQVYLGAGAAGVDVVDVSNPLAPTLAYNYNTPGYTHDITLANGLVWVADSEAGVLALSAGTAQSTTSPNQPGGDPWPVMAPALAARPYTIFSPASPESQSESLLAPQRAPITCTVSSTASSGAGTLRACLYAPVSGDIIVFSPSVFPAGSPATIKLTSELPKITVGGLTIDASNAGVIVDGANVNNVNPTGLKIHSDGNTVRGLQIINFRACGIEIHGGHNLIGGSRLVGSGPTGQGNVLSGNTILGINMNHPDPAYTGDHENIIQGNIIGLNAAGTAVLGEQETGIHINNTTNNVIGSLEDGKNNIISGHRYMGIELIFTSASGNQILGNFIGTNLSGTAALGNNYAGIVAWLGAHHTLIQGNLVSGNGAGILLWDPNSDYNTVIGNKVGTNYNGTALLPNRDGGIKIGGPGFTRIGGTAPGEGNLVGDYGAISVWSPRSANNLVLGNQIGLNLPPGAEPPFGYGISMGGGSRTIVGGASSAEKNRFMVDRNFSLFISSDHNVIMGNDFNMLANGTPSLRQDGRSAWVRADENILQGNRMAYSDGSAIAVDSPFQATARRNAIYSNQSGIYSDMPWPESVNLNSTGGSGTSCPGCTIELFFDAGNQGRIYLDSVKADAGGNFSFHRYCPLAYPNLTMTATSPSGGTSSFAGPWAADWNCSAARPAPTLSGVSPNSAQAPSATLLLAINGADFQPDSVVRWNGAALKTLYVSGAQLQAVVPYTLLLDGGSIPLTVYTPAPGGGVSAAQTFTLQPAQRLFLPLTKK